MAVHRGEPTHKMRGTWVAGVAWSADLRFRGESYGWEAQILRDGELSFGHRAFVTRAAAVVWAEEQRKESERGFLE
jgi:hypothetical protein